jgi:hypothetical protein
MKPRTAIYKPDMENDYAVFKCTKCKALIHGLLFGHAPGCPAPDYSSTVMYFGPNCVPFIEKSKKMGFTEWNGISIKRLLKKAKEKKE